MNDILVSPPDLSGVPTYFEQEINDCFKSFDEFYTQYKRLHYSLEKEKIGKEKLKKVFKPYDSYFETFTQFYSTIYNMSLALKESNASEDTNHL